MRDHYTLPDLAITTSLDPKANDRGFEQKGPMTLRVLGWAEHARESPSKQQALIAWKLNQFRQLDWGGTRIAKWGGTASPDQPLDDWKVPLGCVALMGVEIAKGETSACSVRCLALRLPAQILF